MGYQLRRWLRDQLPPECTSGERLLALEIADQANEDTRRCWPTLEELARWTGLSTATVPTLLARLGRHGWEFRVPIGQGKDGRPVFACAGTKTVYRVPTERADPRQPFQRLGGKRADDHQPSGLTSVSPEGCPSSAPSPQSSPQDSPQEEPFTSAIDGASVVQHPAVALAGARVDDKSISDPHREARRIAAEARNHAKTARVVRPHRHEGPQGTCTICGCGSTNRVMHPPALQGAA